MFKILFAIFLLSIVPIFALEEEPKSGPICELCTTVLTAAKSLLVNNQTEEQVLGFIEKNLCARLGPLNGTCVNLLETEGKQILDELANNVDPQTVCKKLSLCATERNAVLNEVISLVTHETQPNSLNCTICKLVMTQIQNLLQSNQSEAQILSYIEQHVCGALGPLDTICKTLVETYGPTAIKLLSNKVNPEQVCEIIGMCPKNGTFAINHLIIDRMTVDSKQPNSLNCTICKLVMTQIQNLLQSNQSEAQIISYIEQHVCSALGPLDTICKTLVETYGPTAIKLLSNKVDPEQVCEIIGMCPKNGTFSLLKPFRPLSKLNAKKLKTRSGPVCELCTLVLNAAKNLLQNNQTDDQVISFIEKNLCDRLGPLSGICVSFLETEGKQILYDLAHNVDPDTICKKFGLCETRQKLTVLVQNDVECTVCQYIVQFLDLQLQGNKTEAAIVNALENVCKLTPASLKAKCENIIDTYGQYLVQLLVEFADPLKVCQAIKLCN